MGKDIMRLRVVDKLHASCWVCSFARREVIDGFPINERKCIVVEKPILTNRRFLKGCPFKTTEDFNSVLKECIENNLTVDNFWEKIDSIEYE